MKIKLNKLIAVTALVVFLFGGGSHGSAQRANTPQPIQDPDLQAIRNNVLTVKGMKFPKLVPNPTARMSGVSCCTIGDTKTQVVIPFRQEEQAAKKGKVTYERTTPYSPPSTCWVISAHNLSTSSARGASYNLTAVPGGYNFVTSTQYQQTYQDVKDAVLKLNILDKFKIDLIANLKQFTDNYASYAQSLSVSHGSVLLYVKLEGQGNFNGRSWYEGTVSTTETCCPPEISDPVELKAALTTWVSNTVNALPNKGKGPVRSFYPGTAVPYNSIEIKSGTFTPGPSPSPPPGPRQR